MEILIAIIMVCIGILMLLGIALNLVGLPGNWLVFIALLLSNPIRDDPLSWFVIAIFLLVTVASTLIDNVTISLGAKRMGAGRWGVTGAFVGMLVGLMFGGLIGVIIGPFLGAFLAELLIEKKEVGKALKSGFGTFVGFITAIVLKIGVGVAMFSIWLWTLLN